MKTATRQGNLQQLAQQLQQPLNSLVQPSSFQVQCVVKQGSLLVLSQHLPDVKPDPDQVFSALQQAIQSLPTSIVQDLVLSEAVADDSSTSDEVGSESALVKLYLRAQGQKQPYAVHSFVWQPVLELDDPFGLEGMEELLGSRTLDESDDRLAPEQIAPPPDPIDLSLEERLVLEPLEDSSALTYPVPQPQEPVSALPRRSRPKLLPWLILGLASGGVALAAGVFVLTRPCVLGPCEPLQTAQVLSQQSTQAIQTATSEQALTQAQQQLTEADRLLNHIPPWSVYREQAKELRQSYRSQSDMLNQVMAAVNQAAEAAQKSQPLPQPIANWQSIATLWQGAIAQLQAVPQSSPLHSFAQQRLTNYRQNLATVKRNVAAEQQAQQKLKAAKDTAAIAQTRQDAAQSVETWQQARVTWQVAVNALQQIPNGTTSYPEAQQFLSNYEQKLAEARTRQTQEQTSQKTYTLALNLAQKAQGFQKQNQWFRAVSTWRDALTYAKQVPNGTLYHSEIQPKVAEYTSALKAAEAQLQAATALQKVRADLNTVCSGSPKVCSYTMTQDSIQVQLTSAYERAVRNAFIIGRSGDYGTLGGAVNHLDSLESALQAISNNAGVPLVVYNADGDEMIGAFNPRG